MFGSSLPIPKLMRRNTPKPIRNRECRRVRGQPMKGILFCFSYWGGLRGDYRGDRVGKDGCWETWGGKGDHARGP